MTRRRAPDPGLVDEPVLHEDLQALQHHWRKEPGPQPPEQLDLAVLRAARAALPSGRRRAWPWTRGWIHNLATAAVVVLAVTVLLELRQAAQEQQADTDSIQPEAAAAPASAPVQLLKEQVDEARTRGADQEEVHAWLERMERLYADGEFAALAQEVERFRAAYPDTPLPEHLQP